MNKKASITFWGGVGSVTGANFLLEGEGFRALIDCGILQGESDADEKNRDDLPYDVTSIDFLFITHAHMDHIGRIPKLVKDGFKGVIFSTPATKEIASLMLADAARIIDSDARKEGILPSYSAGDVSKAFSLWKTIPYHTDTKIAEHLSVHLKDAGHILGSSQYIFTVSDASGHSKNILFAGDLGNSPSLLLPDAEFVDNADYVVLDSVYGDRNHEGREERASRFKYVIEKTIAEKGTLVIPAFSLERTQTILYELNQLVEAKQIPSVPVFLDSPLAISVTEIYERMAELFNSAVTTDIRGGDKIFEFPRFKETARVAESHQIDKVPGPKIVIAGSGMSTGGRVLHHEALYLPDAKNTLLLMGYQAVGTLGRLLEEGAKEVLINNAKVPVCAHIENITGYSGHRDSDGLLEFAERAMPRAKTFFIVMGEPKSSLFLSQKIRDNLGAHTVIPERGKVYEIPLE